MNATSIQAQVADTVATIFNVPIESVTLESSPTTIENWDSMGHLMLVLELEQQFETQLSPEEVESIKDVRGIIALIQTKQKSGSRE